MPDSRSLLLKVSKINLRVEIVICAKSIFPEIKVCLRTSKYNSTLAMGASMQDFSKD